VVQAFQPVIFVFFSGYRLEDGSILAVSPHRAPLSERRCGTLKCVCFAKKRQRGSATVSGVLRLTAKRCNHTRRRVASMRFGKFMLMLIVVLSATPAVALAQPVMIGGGGPMPMPLMMMLKQLNLTPDQQTKVHEIMASNFAEAKPLMKQLGDIHEQIADKLMSSGPVSSSDIEPLQQQENQIHQELDEQMLSTALQIRGLLTPEQLIKASDLHKKLKSLRQQTDALMGDNGPVMIMGAPPPF
jgi:Spy/CpxP family protein refolding chaperone